MPRRSSAPVDLCVYIGYPESVSDTTTVRIDRATHEELRRLAHERQITVSEAVARGARLLRQEQMGQHLAAPLDDAERAWLDADLG
jgi:hypothetical protein